MKALRKFGIGLVALAITLTGCNSAEANGVNKDTTIAREVNSKETSTDCEYTDKLFDASYVHTINIEIADEDWQDLVTNPLDETYYSCNITIDGETYKNIGLRTKGNSSLTQVAHSDSDRYSFKIKFDKFDKEQDYYGLEKLSLNNIIQDATFMKDYLSYKLMGDFGVASPYVSYSYITINDEEWGLYLNVEDIDSSFLDRNYGEDHGELYKPGTDIDNMAQGGKDKIGNNGVAPNMPEGAAPVADENQATTNAEATNAVNNQSGELPTDMPNIPENFSPENMPNMPENFNPENMPEGFNPGQMRPDGGKGMGGGMEAKGADLKYVDDEASSYANIFDNAETKIDDTDKERLIASLKQLSTGENLEEVVDIDATLRYFVVHNFVDNYDSYTGTMLHNYYLYEEDGKLSMLPWDYNLAFGAFGGAGGGMGGGRNMERPNGMPGQEGASNADVSEGTNTKGASPNQDITKPQGNLADQAATASQSTAANKETSEAKNTVENQAPTDKQEVLNENTQNSATQMVNMAIDTPLSGTTEEERPLWGQLISNATYKEQYHQLFDEFLKNHLENGVVEKEIDRVAEMISPYIQKDPTGFYTYDEFQKGVTTLKSFINLRTESIRKQLNGEIPSTTEGQKTASDKLVDASSINLSDMGSNHQGDMKRNDKESETVQPVS